MTVLRQLLETLAHAKMPFYVIAWLMALLVLGTVAQKYVGLYAAQQAFFYSWVLWVGPVPLPGGLPTLGLLTLSLLAKLFYKSAWCWRHSGIIIAHIGALLLMLGGLLTFAQAKEGSLTLFPGEQSNRFIDYHAREWVITTEDETRIIARMPFEETRPGARLNVPNTNVTIEVVKSCRNCRFPARPKNTPVDPALRGRAAQFDISSQLPEKEDEANVAGAQFRVTGAGPDQDGIYFSTEMIPVAPKITIADQIYHIAVRRVSMQFPFTIELRRFDKESHPGTDMARAYRSEVIVRDAGAEWHGLIEMNAPLRYRGYTLYQSSFIEDGEKTGTVLAVVQNAGRLFPYIASGVMCLGLLLHLVLRLRRLRHVALIAALLGTLSAPALATDNNTTRVNLEDFRRIPILDQGRIKPLDTFARSLLQQFTGRDTIDGRSAAQWLIEVLADPEQAANQPLFRVSNPTVRHTLNLPPAPGHRYNYQAAAEGLRAQEPIWRTWMNQLSDERTLEQSQILDLLGQIDTFTQLTQSLSLIDPDFVITDPDLARALQQPVGQRLTYLDLAPQRANLNIRLKRLAQRLEKNPKSMLTSGEQDLVRMAQVMDLLSMNTQNHLFRVIPPSWPTTQAAPLTKHPAWLSPWATVSEGQGSPQASALLHEWQNLLLGWQAENPDAVAQAAYAIRIQTTAMARGTPGLEKIPAEITLNDLRPFALSTALYALALLAAIGGMFSLFSARWKTICVWFALTSIFAGLLLHLGGIGLRMWVMERPPITNLYSSIVFVSASMVIAGLWVETYLRNGLGLFAAALTGAFLQMIGLYFDAEGDQMSVMIAVLDTNFWLGTHVVVITLGYAAALLTAIIAHAVLVNDLIKPNRPAPNLARVMIVAAVGALFLTALGTILGGIWADQSWGRFWGWDPKENGALLIVLWLIWILHGRQAGMIGPHGTAALLALTTVIVALAWFGVNLLAVGLHSYGFTQGAQHGFIAFCGLEFILIAIIYAGLRLRPQPKAPAT